MVMRKSLSKYRKIIEVIFNATMYVKEGSLLFDYEVSSTEQQNTLDNQPF